MFSPQVCQWKEIDVDEKSQAGQTKGHEMAIGDVTNEANAVCNFGIYK